jgi:hypothetical protein
MQSVANFRISDGANGRSAMKKLLLLAAPAALVMVHLWCGQVVADPAAPGAVETALSPPGAAPPQSENSRALPVPHVNLEEERVFRTLTRPTQVDFSDFPLPEAMQFLSACHDISIRIDAET